MNDRIMSRPASDAYRENFDKAFGIIRYPCGCTTDGDLCPAMQAVLDEAIAAGPDAE